MSVSRRKIYWILTSGIIVILLIGVAVLNERSVEESSSSYAFTDQPELISDYTDRLKYDNETNQFWGSLPEGGGLYVSRFSPNALKTVNVSADLESKRGLVFLKPSDSFESHFTNTGGVEEIRAVMINSYEFETRANKSNYCKSVTPEFYLDGEKVGEVDVENTHKFKNYTLSVEEKGVMERLFSSPSKTISISLKDQPDCDYWEQNLLLDKLELN